MVAVRRYAEFRADFPDDHIWNDDGSEVIQTGGKAIARAIADILEKLGCTIDALEDHVGHCWECNFTYEGLSLFFQVVDLGPCIFVMREPHKARPDFALYFHILLKLNAQLRRDDRFADLAWYTYDDRQVGTEAFQVPVDGDIPPVEQINKKVSF